RRPVGQEIDDAAPFEVGEDRPIPVALLPGPVVDTEDADRRRLWIRHGTGATKERVRTRAHAELSRHPRSGLAAQRESQQVEGTAEPVRPSCVDSRRTVEPLGEDAPLAVRLVAEEPPRLDLEPHGGLVPGQVGENAAVAAVNPRGRRAACRTGNTFSPGTGVSHDPVSVDGQRFEPDLLWSR